MNDIKNVIFFLSIFACVCFTACKNPVIEKWWVDDQSYIPIVKDVPILEVVRETIINEIQLPPNKVLQDIEIIGIEYILFSGEARKYNGKPENGAVSDLTLVERKSNNANIVTMAEELRDHDDYLIILHGHANPVVGSEQEKQELEDLSKARAIAVKDVLVDLYEDGDVTSIALNPPMGLFDPTDFGTEGHCNPLDDTRVATRGYAGSRNLSDSNSYAGLNRRVELILIRIVTETS